MTTPVNVVVGDEPLRVDQIVSVARGAAMSLGPSAHERIRASRAVVDRYVSGDELIYGLNTGLGHMRNTRVPLDSLRAYQPAIVAMHAGGIGPALAEEIVRAAMAVRVAGIARGGAGASLEVAETLIAMLNSGVHPTVPRTGSVGASDLMHMAAIGLVVVGEGRATYRGEVIAGGEALRRAGIAPARLEPKDGLAVVSANGVSVGHAALLSARADEAARLADLALAASLEAVLGNLSIVDDAVALAKPVPGQRESASFVRALLAGSDRCRVGAANSVQDPLSFRVGPQVHGALRETNRYLRDQVNIELAAMDDNPLVDISSGRMISNGNFHPLAMALAADALRPALAHVGQLSDRRLNHLWTVVASDIDVTTIDPEQTSTFAGLLMRYSSAVRYAELREIAGPVTLDIAPLDLGVEDHATNAVAAVQRSETALDLLDDLLAVELLVSTAILRQADPGSTTLGTGVAAMVGAVSSIISDVGPSPASDEIHASVKSRLYDRVLKAATAAVEVAPD